VTANVRYMFEGKKGIKEEAKLNNLDSKATDSVVFKEYILEKANSAVG